MVIVDTSGLVAYFDASDRHHRAAAGVVDGDPGPFIVSPYVVAEIDYLIGTRRGVGAQLAVLDELTGGAWELAQLGASELTEAADVVRRYRDQEIGIADASLVVLAERFRTRRLLTLDHRHFHVLRAADGGPFELLP